MYIDSADQATITELRKYKRLNGSLHTFIDAYKKVVILDRIKLQLGWIQQGCYLVLKVSIFKTFKPLFGIMKISKKV